MGYKVAPLARLIEQFERMPGIGKKSAQRIAFHVLGMSEKDAKNFAQCIIDAHEKIHRCSVCGDLTDNAIRDKLVVIRSDSGNRQMGEINLTTKELLDSPYYYLHNNDIVYVEPTERHKRISDRNPDTPKYISIAVSVASLIRTNLQTARFNQTH